MEQQRRISHAEQLLSDTDLTIGQIARTVGYSNAGRFAQLFHKNTGLLPGEFRKR
ncbi:MAG: helix-turn-helix domain-containing protein [Paenibacillaceae bacterium]|nr:helix-turn-helix domain-containing protein [Paenibacillaceae bacterium]